MSTETCKDRNSMALSKYLVLKERKTKKSPRNFEKKLNVIKWDQSLFVPQERKTEIILFEGIY